MRIPEPAQPTAYTFLDALVRSLGQAHDAVVTLRSVSESKDLVQLMTANQNAGIALGRAVGTLEPFASSPDTNMSEAAAHVVEGYELMRRSLAIQLKAYEQLDDARVTADMTGMSRRVSDSQVAYQQGSSILALATSMAFGSAVVPDQSRDSSHIALNLTASEKARLIEELHSQFGTSLSDTTERLGPVPAARILYNGLSQQWRLAR